MSVANTDEFNDPNSRRLAMGVSSSVLLYDHKGIPFAHRQNGGIAAPTRHELKEGVRIYRFGSAKHGVFNVAKGQWWLEEDAFSKVKNFANEQKIDIAVAARQLCFVPNEWSSMDVLVIGRTTRGLLCWRGRANDVNMPLQDGHRLKVYAGKDVAAPTVLQIFVPGLNAYVNGSGPISIETQVSTASKGQAFLYGPA